MKRIDILTLFPDMCSAAFSESIVARAIKAGHLEIDCHQIRTYTEDRQGKVDDYPYGGGPGLIMSYQPVKSCYDAVLKDHPTDDGGKPYTVYMSPQGTPFTQQTARRLAKLDRLVIICGHYEGIDERIIEDIVDEEISMGDFVLTGGEIPAMAVADCIARLVPGVLASDEAYENESHSDILLEYAQYTRPEVIAGKKVPDVLLRGNHADIEQWRLENAIGRTKEKRPDLYEKYMRREREKNTYYFDNSATTKQWDEVTARMARVCEVLYANPSSLHGPGFDAEKELTSVRRKLLGLIGGEDSGNLYFTSGATEANNWVFRSILPANPRLGRHVIISAVEHPSVSESALSMKEQGCDVEIAPVDADGRVNVAKLAEMIRPGETALVSVMHVNSETGSIQPVEEIVREVRRLSPGTLVHCDCVQSFGKISVNVKKLGADLISVSAHKIHGPRGIGFLYADKRVKIKPLLYGGGQENGFRSGTENLPAICGFETAASVICGSLDDRFSKAARMKEIFTSAITSGLKTYVLNSPEENCSPYILNVSFPGLRAEVILHTLEKSGIYVSVGSACSSHKKNRSAVLTAMGKNTKVIDGAIRISFSADNTEEQCEFAAKTLVREIKTLYALHSRKKN
ncbi:MAG: tRNA (guanosine(37)-N1)-methyltransferase TrmD [Clostridia bacterium]|nr:tRNA (guanosine(37)-N1)-methyltransferase TrmD [Clostridia bacterium]